MEIKGIDSPWDLKGNTLNRYYTGTKENPSKRSGGIESRLIPMPDEERQIAIYDYLKSVGYITEDDLVEPDNWLIPDLDVMSEMGLSQRELGKSKIPHLLGRDYVSYKNSRTESATSLMSIYTKWVHKHCKVRYITKEIFRTNTTNEALSKVDDHWKWYWGWMLFENESSGIVKIIKEGEYRPRPQCFWLDKFIQTKEHITDISMLEPIQFYGDIPDKRIIELIRQSVVSDKKPFRQFMRSTATLERAQLGAENNDLQR